MQSLTGRFEEAAAHVDALPWVRELHAFRSTGEYSTTYACGRFSLRATRLATHVIVCWFVDSHGDFMQIGALEMAHSRWQPWWPNEETIRGTMSCKDFSLFTRNLQYIFRHDSANPCDDTKCTACRHHRIATCEALEIPLDTNKNIGFVCC